MAAKPHLVIAGGGVAAVETLLTLHELAPGRASVTLVAPGPDFVYRPLSVGEPFGRTAIRRVPLDAIADEHGARFRLARLERVDPVGRRALLADGDEIAYDALAVCIGARPVPIREDALTFRGPEGIAAMRTLLANVTAGRVERVAFVVPPGAGWALPIYELALMTAAHARDASCRPSLTLVTAEAAPVEIFGAAASRAVATALEAAGVELIARTDTSNGAVDALRADQIVTLPRLIGPGIRGLPRDREGFILTDASGRVPGFDHVYAAGDGIAFPIKQGGLAAQQADAVGETLAASLGAQIEPRPFEPILRGVLITGAAPTYLRANGRLDSEASDQSLWWPPSKIVGRRLAPYLAARDPSLIAPAEPGGVPVDVVLSADPAIRPRRREPVASREPWCLPSSS
jgi:sulfide:quinone oxidoreductase